MNNRVSQWLNMFSIQYITVHLILSKKCCHSFYCNWSSANRDQLSCFKSLYLPASTQHVAWRHPVSKLAKGNSYSCPIMETLLPVYITQSNVGTQKGRAYIHSKIKWVTTSMKTCFFVFHYYNIFECPINMFFYMPGTLTLPSVHS